MLIERDICEASIYKSEQARVHTAYTNTDLQTNGNIMNASRLKSRQLKYTFFVWNTRPSTQNS